MLKSLKVKSLFFIGTLLFVTTVLLAGCGGGQPTEKSPEKAEAPKTEAPKEEVKPITLTLAHFFPATHMLEADIVQSYAKEVEAATGGKVKIVSYPSSTLIPAPEIYDGVVKGVADMGISVYAYNRGRFPVVEAFLVPGLEFNNSIAATEALREGIQKLNPKELQDAHQMLSFAAGPADLFTKKPVRKLADLKGMQLGATAGLRADAIGLLGAAPVVQPMPEWYESLSKGVMQGGVAPLEALDGFRLGEVSGNYITLTPFLYNQAFFLTMNNDKWNSLSADVQKAMTEVSEKFYKERFAPMFSEIDVIGVKKTKEKKKVEFITLSDEEKAIWKEKIKPLEAQYIKTLDERGLPGADIMKTVRELVDKYNAQYPEIAPYAK